MHATPNSRRVRRFLEALGCRPQGFIRRVCLAGLMVFAFAGGRLRAAGTNLTLTVPPLVQGATLERLGRNFQEARVRLTADPANATNAWLVGRASFELAELTTNNPAKAEIAEQGIAACRQAIARAPGLAPAHYYLGMTIGQLADTKRNMSALKMVREMEREFIAARELDAPFDFAGADRNLGLLYHEAPSFISIGSRTKARQHLKAAVELAPDFPENRLNLIETLLTWGDHEDARHELKALEKHLPALKQKFPGTPWIERPTDWQKRLEAAQKKTAALAK